MIDKPHKNLDVWKKSLDLIIRVYKLTKDFPHYEYYGIVAQMRRAALSISSNIAEGAARQTKKEFIQHLYIAQGSLSELDTQFEIAKSLGYLVSNELIHISELAVRVDKMITGLIKSLKRKQGTVNRKQ